MNTRKGRWAFAAVLAVCAAGLAAWAQLDPARTDAMRLPREAQAKAVEVYPHDARAFTQGLAMSGGRLYEGTGQYGRSSLRRVDLATGRVEKRANLAQRYFGEGITVLGDRIYQLTWRSGVGFVYDVDSFDLTGSFRYAGEGWGLTDDGSRLIVSDGTDEIRFMNPETFEVVRRIGVRWNGRAVDRLNELEYVRGEIWANVWYEDRIARISPDDGAVLGWIDIGNLYPPSARGREDVANGIAFDPESGRVLVTGKNWPQVFEIEIVPR